MALPDGQTEFTASEMDRRVGDRIRRRRILMGLTQDQLGEALGISYQQIQKYETGANRVSAGRLYLIATKLAVPPGWFFDPVNVGDNDIDLDQIGSSRLLMDFVRSFSKIDDERLKSVLVSLVRAISEQSDDTLEEALSEIAPSNGHDQHPG